jgi:hypothetical protein
MIPMLQASSPDAIPRHTNGCQATPATALATPIKCDIPWPPPKLRTPPRELSNPMKLANLHHTALHCHRKRPPLIHHHQQCQSRVGSQELPKPSWVSRDDASKERMMPVAPLSLVRRTGQDFHPENPMPLGWSSKMTPPTGRKTL